MKLRLLLSYLIVAICLGPTNLSAQIKPSFAKIDAHARSAPKSLEDDLPALVQYLVTPATTDIEKARSIFTWLIYALDFDNRAYRHGNKRLNRTVRDILRRRKAVCFGYAQLFQQLCKHAKLPCQIISGYTKTGLYDRHPLTEPNHAWNAIKLDGQWYLLDATWASNLRNQPNAFMRNYQQDYFLTSPELFVIEHLPADPMWQLSNSPITAKQFWKSSRPVKDTLTAQQSTFSYQDSIVAFERLPAQQQKLKTAFNAYHFLPSTANGQELGATYMDHEYYLSIYADDLQGRKAYDSLRIVQQEMLALCAKASALDILFANQKENCAYTHMNYATALSDKAQEASDPALQQQLYTEMAKHFQSAEQLLQSIPTTVFTEQALQRCAEYLDWLRQLEAP